MDFLNSMAAMSFEHIALQIFIGLLLGTLIGLTSIGGGILVVPYISIMEI